MDYIAGTNLTFTIPIVGSDGTSVSAQSAKYSLLDEEGALLVTDAAVPGFVVGNSSVTITIVSALNTLESGQVRGAREIVLTCTDSDGAIVIVNKAYVIVAASGTLIRGVNTLVTVAGADMLAVDMPGMSAWSGVNRSDKVIALAQAYKKLCQIRLNDVPAQLGDLTGPEVLALNSDLLMALSLAQVAEAGSISVGETELETRRKAGLILDTIGESKQMYKSTTPVNPTLSRRAMAYLSKFAASTGVMKIGRA